MGDHLSPRCQEGLLMALNQTDRHQIQVMRAAGVAYSRIAAHLGLNANSVKTYCLRHGITVDPAVEQVTDPVGVWCLHCCKPIKLRQGSKFCSTACRRAWWAAHRRVVTEELVCANCHQQVTVARTGQVKRKYCCHPCYVQHRFNSRGGKR